METNCEKCGKRFVAEKAKEGTQLSCPHCDAETVMSPVVAPPAADKRAESLGESLYHNPHTKTTGWAILMRLAAIINLLAAIALSIHEGIGAMINALVAVLPVVILFLFLEYLIGLLNEMRWIQAETLQEISRRNLRENLNKD